MFPKIQIIINLSATHTDRMSMLQNAKNNPPILVGGCWFHTNFDFRSFKSVPGTDYLAVAVARISRITVTLI